VCPDGVVAVTGDTLRILATERLGELFNQTVHPVRYTPRKFSRISAAPSVVAVIETDHNAVSHETAEASMPDMAMDEDNEDEDEEDVEAAKEKKKVLIGPPKANQPGKWASCIRLMEAVNGDTLDIKEFDEGEAAFSLTACTFSVAQMEYLVVGTVKDMTLFPRSAAGGFLYTFKVINGGRTLELVHKTPVDDVPYALCPFQGRLLVGTGKVLRVYELGKKKLLRKCENKGFPHFITTLDAIGDRVIVGDIQESFFYCKYHRAENRLTVFADDSVPRWVSASCLLDYDTMVGADKFGNIFIERLPEKINDDLDEDPTAFAGKTGGLLNGAPHKVDQIVQYHVGETVTSVQRCTLVPGGVDVIVYATIMGGIGVLLPFASREDVDFFQHLEMHLRQSSPPICGRDHMAFRSYYFPVKDVIDGDLCEQFTSLASDLQNKIASELDRTPAEVGKKLEELRNRIM
jgi:splicing factor 3B subunit 3